MMSQSRSGTIPRVDGVRVLVVDDCAANRELVTATLERSGATVTAVSCAERALEVVTRERPDVLVSDIEMPDKDGFWLIGQVRALPPQHGGTTPAVALTGLADAENRARVLRGGFQYHVAKPVDIWALVGVVAILALKE